VVGASLAKGFGVPVALLAGSAAVLRRFLRDSASREHMSPPSMAAVQATWRALAVNREAGDRLRLRLWRLVRRLRSALPRLRLTPHGNDFPVQTVFPPPGTDVQQLHADLRRRGVLTVLHRGGGAAGMSFLVRADHDEADIDHAIAQLALSLRAMLVPA
jgi:8-amino-7-oxononanoate synthase